MEPWGMPSLTEYTYKDVQIQNDSKLSITEKRRIRLNTSTDLVCEED